MAEGDGLAGVPAWEMKNFCRWLVKATEEYFKDPQVQARYEAWLKEREGEVDGKVY